MVIGINVKDFKIQNFYRKFEVSNLLLKNYKLTLNKFE